MEGSMFCFQCQEAAKGSGCVLKGVCGKESTTARYMDLLLFVVRGVAVAADVLRNNRLVVEEEVNLFVTDALFATITNANFDDESILKRVRKGLVLRDRLKAQAREKGLALPEKDELDWNGTAEEFDSKSATVGVLREKNEDIRSLKELLVYGLKGMAAYHEHAIRLGHSDEALHAFMQQALAETALDRLTAEEWVALVLMLLDHLGEFFPQSVPLWFRWLGRMSAPLFLFCTGEGFAHAHDRKRYFLRIWAIATAMGTVEFFMMYAGVLRRGDGFYPLNAIMQNFVILCIIWQGIDWLREKKFAKGIGAIAAVLCWPYVVVVFLLLFPGVQEMPIASTIVAFVITSPLPMWTAITDGSWSFLLGGVLLYALRGRRKVQLTVWALVIFLCDFALTFGMACRQEGFVWTQMFTDNYEWFGVAAVLLMLLYNGQRGKGHKQLFYWFYPAHVYLLYGASCLLYNVLR